MALSVIQLLRVCYHSRYRETVMTSSLRYLLSIQPGAFGPGISLTAPLIPFNGSYLRNPTQPGQQRGTSVDILDDYHPHTLTFSCALYNVPGTGYESSRDTGHLDLQGLEHLVLWLVCLCIFSTKTIALEVPFPLVLYELNERLFVERRFMWPLRDIPV